MSIKKNLTFVFGLIGWFAIVGQYYLMVNARTTSVLETTIRFFSFFTILTNSIVAIYFTRLFISQLKNTINPSKPGTLTAVTVYITIVGLVYQVVLRQVWQPEGFQKLVDELLHTVIPLLVILFWYLYENCSTIKYTQITKWIIYPLVYLLCVLLLGSISSWYPYPFINVAELGMAKVLLNSALLILLFVLISSIFLFLGKKIARNKTI